MLYGTLGLSPTNIIFRLIKNTRLVPAPKPGSFDDTRIMSSSGLCPLFNITQCSQLDLVLGFHTRIQYMQQLAYCTHHTVRCKQDITAPLLPPS